MNDERLLELAMLHLDGRLDKAAEAELSAWLERSPRERHIRFDELVDVAAALVLAGAEDAEIPEDGLSNLLAAVEAEEALPPVTPGFSYLREQDSPWVELPQKGLRIRTVSDHPDDAFTIVVLEMDPGAVYPRHHHKGVESGYILSGDLEMDGRMFRAGDFMRAAPGSDHPDFVSPSGCQALLVMARENFPRKTVKGLSWVNRLLRRGGAHT